MTCGETAGFLFNHDCGREAAANCHLCGKGICSMHTRTTDGQIFCITCLKRYMSERAERAQGQPADQPAQGVAAVAGAGQRPGYGVTPWYIYDDPYWYTSRHYPSYHGTDMTAADRKAFESAPEPAGEMTPGEDAFETEKEAS